MGISETTSELLVLFLFQYFIKERERVRERVRVREKKEEGRDGKRKKPTNTVKFQENQ